MGSRACAASSLIRTEPTDRWTARRGAADLDAFGENGGLAVEPNVTEIGAAGGHVDAASHEGPPTAVTSTSTRGVEPPWSVSNPSHADSISTTPMPSSSPIV